MQTQEQEEKEGAEADAEGGGEGEDEEQRRRGEEEKKSLRVPQGACICRYLCGLTWGDDPQTRVHRWHKITGITIFLVRGLSQ